MIPRLPSISGEKVIRALKRSGWKIKSQKSSHVKLVKSGVKRIIVVPVHKGKSIDRGLLHSIIKHAELTVDKFIELL